MLVTITIPDAEERTVSLVQDLVTIVQRYPGVEMKTVTRPRLRNAGKRSAAAVGKKKAPGHRPQVSVDGGGRGSGG
jgi:hypothetical protein